MTVQTIGGIDHASWYDLYEAVMAVDMLCARNSPPLQGIATGIGTPARQCGLYRY